MYYIFRIFLYKIDIVIPLLFQDLILHTDTYIFCVTVSYDSLAIVYMNFPCVSEYMYV